MHPKIFLCNDLGFLTKVDTDYDKIIFIVGTESLNCEVNYDSLEACFTELFSRKDLSRILFLSKHDVFNNELISCLQLELCSETVQGIIVLVPYKSPPLYDYRDDGNVNSFLIDAKYFTSNTLKFLKKGFHHLLYASVMEFLQNDTCKNLKIVQVGKPIEKQINKEILASTLDKSVILIPHKGTLAFLKRCLSRLKSTSFIPSKTMIMFDDNTYRAFDHHQYDEIGTNVELYVNSPLNVGPYLGRHYGILETDADYIFFQDSDDISISSRFEIQMQKLISQDLDLIGSHELRIDQFLKRLILIRFPLDVNYAFRTYAIQPLFHPTSLIKKIAYLKAGGFSTDQKFGYDLQFTMRGKYFLKMGNCDDFLYIRFKRPGSLTTHKKTKIGSDLRSFMWWRWRIEMKFVDEGKLNLNDSSLSTQKHKFKFILKKIPLFR
jgi:hypothetical protein